MQVDVFINVLEDGTTDGKYYIMFSMSIMAVVWDRNLAYIIKEIINREYNTSDGFKKIQTVTPKKFDSNGNISLS